MQSGISVSQELHSAFTSFTANPSDRALLITIQDEALKPLTTIPSTSDFNADITTLNETIQDNEPAYIILRRDDNNNNNNGGNNIFISITYVPDIAHVRKKMLFASTRNTLHRELGTEKFADSLFMTNRGEVSVEGFRKHDAHGARPAPLTEEERVLRGVKEAEESESRGTMHRSSHVSSGVSFPIDDEGLRALQSLGQSGQGVVQLGINMEQETIGLVDHWQDSIAVGELSERISNSAPRYTFFAFQHTYESEQQSPIVFLYTCPSSSKIKERMLYASCRSTVLTIAEKDAGLVISRKMESAEADVTESQLLEEFHPRREEKASFSRPKRPGRK